ncbi:MAG: transposase [Sarcina sp.]
MFCLNQIKQLNLFDQVSELKYLSTNEPTTFLDLLSNKFDLESFIPKTFYDKFYNTLGRNRKYKLSSVLSALILMQIFHIPTNTLLRIFLIFSSEIREFCKFDNGVPDETYFSKFKRIFEENIADLFNSMAIETINICDKINESLPENSPYKDLNTMLIYDTSGLKPKVKENNPKTIRAFINNQKLYAKVTNNKNHNPYAAAYKAMPKCANANSDIKLDFVNGHFGYFYKFGILTNGLGIPLAINFFDEKFYSNIQSEFETPEEQKYAYDNASLKSVIKPFLSNLESNSNFRFNTFLGDSEFDSYENFGLLKELNFQKVFIPINSRNQKNSKIKDLEFNTLGIPLCPLNKDEFRPAGRCGGKNRSERFKFVCPKSAVDKKGNYYHTCKTPCTDKPSGRMTYVYPDKDFRLYPGVQRNSTEWAKTYKIRAVIERELSYFKCNPCIQSPNTLNTATMRCDLYLTAISKLINVILAYSLNDIKYIRSIRKLYLISA